MRRARNGLLMLALVAFVAVTLLPGWLHAQETREVDTTTGKVQGRIADNVQQFLGIPYARPPIANLRWKAPVKPQRWTGVKKTQNWAPSCYVVGPFPQNPSIPLSEDCLYLNVYTPLNANTTSQLPVRVWIYGGAYITGSTEAYPAAKLTEASNTIIVSVSYRLNAFGFMALSQLRQEDPALNYGLQDQQLALQWVHDNIQNFGGDTNNVLIFGESAGGSSVVLHMVMKRSWAYYQKAIIESNGPATFPSLHDAQSLGAALVNSTPCATQPADKQLDCMRALTAKEILALPIDLLVKMVPCIDLNQILDQPLKLFAAGLFNAQVPVLLGSNAAEGNLFAYIFVWNFYNTTSFSINATQYTELMNYFLRELAPILIPVYAPLAASKGYWPALSQALGDHISCGTAILAGSIAKARSQEQFGAYRYMFNQTTSTGILSSLNATHGMELQYVFDDPAVFNQGTTFTPGEQSVADMIVTYWTEFHRTGNPNHPGLAVWPRYAGKSRTADGDILVLQEQPTTISHWDDDYCPIWIRILLLPDPERV